MTIDLSRYPLLKWVVGIGCVYELIALPERSPVPTISNILQSATVSKRGRFAAWLFVGYAAAHLFGVDGWED